MIAYDLDGVSRRLPDLDPGERALFAAVGSLTRHLGVQERCDAILEAVDALFGATAAWVLLHDARHRRLRVCGSRGAAVDDLAGLEIEEQAGLVGRAFVGNRLLLVPDVRAEDVGWHDAGDAAAAELVPGALLLPIRSKDLAVGVLAFHSARFADGRQPSKHDIARLEALAALAAVSIEHARLFEETERDRRRLRQALHQRRQLRAQVTQLQQERASASARRMLLGSSAPLERVLGEIDVVARTKSTVLLMGETGTGKELVARAIHEGSRRSDGPFVPVNCAALPEALIESELFGHERGAFTGATNARPGKFQVAHKGTLFLDEIGDLPLDAQAKLLRVLQDGRVERVGSTTSTRVDVRIIAATNANLEQGLADGSFRPDLFYRLSVFPIQLPPLRERQSDIPLLATLFANQCAENIRKPIEGFSTEALDLLVQYDWPGNVRELRNVVERAVLLTPGPVIEADVLAMLASRTLRRAAAADAVTPPRVAAPSPPPPPAPGPPEEEAAAATITTREPAGTTTLADADREAILQALHAAGWRVSGPAGAARMLGLKPTTLHSKMKRLGIRRPGGAPGRAAARRRR